MARGKINPETGLTGKETVFCEQVAYNPEMSLSDAYRAAYSCGRMKATTINKKASELSDKDHIRATIAELREKRNERVEIDADWVLKRLALEADADVADLYYAEGGLKPVHEWPKIWRQGLVSGLDVEQQYMYQDGEKVPDGFITKIKLSDRIKRIELIGKHVDVAAFREIKEHTGRNGGPIQVDARTIAAELDPVEASRLYREFVTGK